MTVQVFTFYKTTSIGGLELAFFKNLPTIKQIPYFLDFSYVCSILNRMIEVLVTDLLLNKTLLVPMPICFSENSVDLSQWL